MFRNKMEQTEVFKKVFEVNRIKQRYAKTLKEQRRTNINLQIEEKRTSSIIK